MKLDPEVLRTEAIVFAFFPESSASLHVAFWVPGFVELECKPVHQNQPIQPNLNLKLGAHQRNHFGTGLLL